MNYIKKKEELIAGNFYLAELRGSTSHTYIFKAIGPLGWSVHISNHKTFNNKGYNGTDWFSSYNVSPATQEQIAHITACIEADKYVDAPKNSIINNYEVF